MQTSFCVIGVFPDLMVEHGTGPWALALVRLDGVVPGGLDLGAEPPAIGYRQPSFAGLGADLCGGRSGRCGRLIEFGDADLDG